LFNRSLQFFFMKPIRFAAIFFVTCLLNFSFLYAQQDSTLCKVKLKELEGSYTGGCRLGFANGQGKARGLDRYTGMFKDGLPNGEGVYYYNDSVYYNGNFQDGIKEGKGETHYLRKAKPDSIIDGFWSGGEYRGKRYITYSFTTTEQLDNKEITPSAVSGNTVTFEMSTTSGSPSGNSIPGMVLQLSSLVSSTSSILKITSKYETPLKTYVTYEIVSFPCKLSGTLSDSQTFELELYKAANWKIRFYKNI
jgi:hypothetical protein